MFFFFNDTATTEIYTLSLHDALPISVEPIRPFSRQRRHARMAPPVPGGGRLQLAAVPDHGRRRLRYRLADRKSTRLNSSHANISYAVFCLKKKKTKSTNIKTCVKPK